MEFGSDFHCCEYTIGKSLLDIYKNTNLYISGRQALIDVVKANHWRCLWVPSYYCHDFLAIVSPYIHIKFYNYTPFEDVDKIVNNINYEKIILIFSCAYNCDGLLRIGD